MRSETSEVREGTEIRGDMRLGEIRVRQVRQVRQDSENRSDW